MMISARRLGSPLPARGERSDRETIRVRGPVRESQRSERARKPVHATELRTLKSVESPPHPDPLPARGEREKGLAS
jgi:hypothetical protein